MNNRTSLVNARIVKAILALQLAKLPEFEGIEICHLVGFGYGVKVKLDCSRFDDREKAELFDGIHIVIDLVNKTHARKRQTAPKACRTKQPVA